MQSIKCTDTLHCILVSPRFSLRPRPPPTYPNHPHSNYPHLQRAEWCKVNNIWLNRVIICSPLSQHGSVTVHSQPLRSPNALAYYFPQIHWIHNFYLRETPLHPYTSPPLHPLPPTTTCGLPNATSCYSNNKLSRKLKNQEVTDYTLSLYTNLTFLPSWDFV